MNSPATAGDAMLADIIADPSDDGLRLIYADWLEDDGRPERAAFIRVQVERASAQDLTTVPGSGMERSDELHKRARAVSRLSDLEDQWVRSHAWKLLRDELPEGLWREFDRWSLTNDGSNPVVISKRDDSLALTFRRGFVSLVRCPLAEWLAHGPAIARAHPIERVEIIDKRPVGGRWACALDEPHDVPRWAVPLDIFRRLMEDLRGEVDVYSDSFFDADISFADDTLANDALSAACIRWARSQP